MRNPLIPSKHCRAVQTSSSNGDRLSPSSPLSPGSNLNPNSRNYVGVAGSTRRYALPPLRLYRRRAPPTRLLRLPRAKAVEIGAPAGDSQRGARESSSVLLEVGGMMCGACASRVRSILAADERVESAVVNMLMETAAVRLRTGAAAEEEAVAEELAARLTECGFPSRRRTRSGSGVGENVRKLKEMAQRKGSCLRGAATAWRSPGRWWHSAVDRTRRTSCIHLEFTSLMGLCGRYCTILM
uniref:HMA domain-containing protein n=1 Tax=Ananas comosus var. bracteatus TaxID=296719 RepID=A0A6V7Q572_ANACO|nr:unnamed protein product [Ananas comosus var. bracteatus]